MANFVVVVDPDAGRRSRFVKAIEPLLPPVEGLIHGGCSTGDFCARWAAGTHAPVSQWADESGAAVIWGDAIAGPGPRRMTAAELMPVWRCRGGGAAATYDGFYAAVVYRPDVGIIVGADLLGMFPVYYYTIGDVLLVGSSPQLFSHHEAFRMEFNPAGLVGMLLTMHIVDGQTLMRGVRRLAASHLLLWKAGQKTTESEQFRIPVTTTYSELPPFAQVDRLDQVLDDVITRHAPPGEQYGLLLSGGLDSRMLGGLLRRQGIGDVVALTIGLRSDIEMQCAIPVASALGFRHRAVDIPYEQYPACADLQAKWEHGLNGFNFPSDWGLYPHLGGPVQRVVMGHAMDTVLSEPACADSGTLAKISFESFFAYQNRWAFQPDVLRKLLRPEIFEGLVADTIDGMRRRYENYAERDFHRAWCFDLHHRARFHVGSTAWASSFGAWPVVPALDRGLIETAGGMSVAILWERLAQREFLCTRFPHLAALSVDRSNFNTKPLQPRLRRRVADHVRSRLHKYGAPFARWRPRRNGGERERRYYHRVCDINGPGWRAIRRQAEPHRERVLEVFNKEALDALLPAPDVPLQLKDGIIDSSGLKSLLGFLLWSRDHSFTLKRLRTLQAVGFQALLSWPIFS